MLTAPSKGSAATYDCQIGQLSPKRPFHGRPTGSFQSLHCPNAHNERNECQIRVPTRTACNCEPACA